MNVFGDLSMSVVPTKCIVINHGGNFGDAFLLPLAHGNWVVVDTGKNSQLWHDGIIAAITEHGISRIVGIILTHQDQDHIGGISRYLADAKVVDRTKEENLRAKDILTLHTAFEALEWFIVSRPHRFPKDALSFIMKCLRAKIGAAEKDQVPVVRLWIITA